MVSLSSGLLQFVSSAYLVTPGSTGTSASVDQAHIQLGELVDQQQGISSGKSASSTASAQLAQDTYTPSSQSSQSESTQYSLVNSLASSAGVSKATMDAMLDTMSNYVDPVLSSWTELRKNMAAGDISAAQASLTDYTQSLAASNLNMSSLTAPSTSHMNDLASMGKALSAGNLTDARAAFTAADNQDELNTNSSGMALGQAESDSGMTVQGLQDARKNGTSFTINSSKLAEDVKNLDDLAREDVKSTVDYLVSKGFSVSDATGYATATDSISNGSAAENAQVDAMRTTEWINTLTNYVKTGSTPSWYVEAPKPGDAMFTAIAGIMNASSIAAWNQTHTLVDSTLGTSSTGSSGSTTGKFSSVSVYA